MYFKVLTNWQWLDWFWCCVVTLHSAADASFAQENKTLVAQAREDIKNSGLTHCYPQLLSLYFPLLTKTEPFEATSSIKQQEACPSLTQTCCTEDNFSLLSSYLKTGMRKVRESK